MWILQKYIISELVKYLFLSIAIFTFVLLVGNIIKLADLIINRGVEIIYIVRLFLYLMPYLLSYTMPMGTLTATIVTFGRLSSDNEIMAIKSSGISLYRIAIPVFICGLVISLISLPLNDKILPLAHYASRKTLKELGVKTPSAYIEPGVFIKDFKNYIIFVYEIKGNILKNIRIYQPQPNGPTRTIIAEKGILDSTAKNQIRLKLINGISEEPDPKNIKNFYKLNFKTYYITLDLEKELRGEILKKKTKEMSTAELRENLKEMRGNFGIDAIPLLTELHKKFSLSFSALLFTLLGLPIGIFIRRGETSIGFGVSLALVIIYWILLAGGNALALKGNLPVWICIWLPNLIVFIIGILLFLKVIRD